MNRDHEKPDYHRPNQNWVCTAEPGCGCPGGPTLQGACAARSPCEPKLENQRWICQRSSHRGGACDAGPDPTGCCGQEITGCVPRRSLRSVRKIFVVSTVSLITGILLLGIWKPNRHEFLAPGGLSSHHAQIWSGPDAEDRCIACHSASATDPIQWVASFFGGGSHVDQPQYQKCLDCHEKNINRDHALLVHNLPRAELEKITARIQAENPQSHAMDRLLGSPVHHSAGIACATCHREHHGADHDLAALTDKQCQSCHAQQFESFERGHPEFKSYAQSPVQNIRFDHYSHQVKHFAEANQAFDCNACHQTDSAGIVMQVSPFETACASCHGPSLDASLTQGLPVFRLPSLDTEWLKKNGLDIGQWPESASGSFDGQLPPMMKVLLASDPRARQAMETLGPHFDLFDTDLDDRQQLVAASQLAIAIKALLLDLSRQGQSALIPRLEKLSPSSMPSEQLQAMIAGLSAETFSAAQEKWFPYLADEEPRLLAPDAAASVPNQPGRPVANQVTPASFSQSLADETHTQDDPWLAENPIKSLMKGGPPNPQPQVASGNPSEKSLPNFEDLPQEAPPKPPLRRPSGRLPSGVGADQLRLNPYSQPDPSESPSAAGGSRANGTVGNQFYLPRTGAPAPTSGQPPVQEPDPATPDDPDLLVPNPIAGKLTPAGPRSQVPNGEPPRDEPPLAISQNPSPGANQNPATVTGPEEDLRKIPPEELLMDNPLARLLKSRSAGGDIPSTGNTAPSDASNETQSPANAHPSAEHPLAKTDVGKEQVGKENSNSTSGRLDKPTDFLPEDQQVQSGAEPISIPPDLNRLPAAQRVPLGGWYRDDQTLTIAYRQTGHADELTRHWYDFVTSIRKPELESALADFKQLIASPISPGQCGSCHQTSGMHQTAGTIVWKAATRDPSVKGFTRFAHRPHLVQPGHDQCATCHELNPAASILHASSDQMASGVCQSGFHPVRKANCTSCHNEQSRIQSCTQCHNYHVGGGLGP